MRDKMKAFLWLGTILSVSLAACGGTATTSFPTVAAPEPELAVVPPYARLAPRETLPLAAIGTAAVGQVSWSIREGAAGGAIADNGLYTAPSLNGTFHIVVASGSDPGKTATATVVVAGQPPPADGEPMTTASRTSGVAPLSVFFDCVDSIPEGTAAPFTWSSGVYQPPDGDYEAVSYVWDFGDAGAGVWSTTGVSRNLATGYTTAHVYESPGTYTASLTITGKDGTVHTYKQTITVSAFSGTTYYVSAAGSDSNNDGLSETTPFRTANRGMQMSNAANRRILLRRGDSFAMDPVTITAAGPGIIGAYGAGSRPVITGGGWFNVRGADWRIMDLDFPGSGGQTPVAFDVSYQTVNALLLRLRSTNWNVGLGWGDWTPILATPHDGATMMECEVATSQTNGVYVGGRRLAILGNDIHDIAASHVLRVWQAHKGVIAHNRLWNPGPTRHALKMHGGAVGDGRPETRWVTVSDNLVRGKTWSMAIGPQDAGSNERVSHVVVERNRTWGESSVQVDLEIWARQVTVRNNIFDGTGSSNSYTAVSVGQRGVEPAPQDVRLLNNTVVRNDSSSEFYGFSVQSVATNVTVRNNLAYAPLVNARSLLAGAGGSGFVEDHNLLASSPGFSDVAAGDYSLQAGSVAVNAAMALPEVRFDHVGALRPIGAAPDLGAFESH